MGPAGSCTTSTRPGASTRATRPRIRAGGTTHLRSDRHPRWPAHTRGGAPHKPLLLLALAQLAEEGRLAADGALALDGEAVGELADCFEALWQALLPERRPVLHLPVWHLRSDGLWTLHDAAGHRVDAAGSISGWRQLRGHAAVARPHPALADCLHDPAGRAELRELLLDTYHDSAGRARLAQAVDELRAARRYGQQLLDGTRNREPLVAYDAEVALPTPVRDAGFRRAVRAAYAHRCATCGLRVRTPDRRSLVQAAHIVPWADTHDDRPVNGLALCPTCHWCFDEQLLRIHPDERRIVCGHGLSEGDNLPAHLQTLDGRGIFEPEERVFAADVGCLRRRWRQAG